MKSSLQTKKSGNIDKYRFVSLRIIRYGDSLQDGADTLPQHHELAKVHRLNTKCGISVVYVNEIFGVKTNVRDIRRFGGLQCGSNGQNMN